MQRTEQPKEAYGGNLLTGAAILLLWVAMIVVLATGVASAPVVAGHYVVLLGLMGTALPVYRGMITGLPFDGPMAWILVAALLSIMVVVVAPVIGIMLIAASLRAKR